MRLKAVLVCLCLAAGLVVVGAPVANAIEDGCHETARGYTCFYPMRIRYDGPTEVFSIVPSPGAAGYITAARATLVDANGERVSHHKAHLHHAVWINPQRSDYTCPSLPGDRFFGSGKERTPMRLPDGYGYRVGTNNWAFTAHIDGMHAGHTGSFRAFIRLNLAFAPLTADLADISPVWLDVTGECPSNARSEFNVPKGGTRFRKSDSWTASESGRFIAMAGHLHDGGLRLTVANMTTGTHIFTSRALYERPSERWYLTRMTWFSDVAGKQIDVGDRLKLTAVYNSTRRWPGVMGIMLGAFVPDTKQPSAGLSSALSEAVSAFYLV